MPLVPIDATTTYGSDLSRQSSRFTMNTAPPASADTGLEELSQHECRLLLDLTTIGRIAFVVDGLPIVFPVNYRFLSAESGPWIVLRTRPGNGLDGAPEQVAFEIDGIDHDHQQGWSVLVRGLLHHLDQDEIERFSERFDPKPWPRRDRTSWLAIKPQSLAGRRLQVAEDEWTVMRRTCSP
jgi:uncharacterized protein